MRQMRHTHNTTAPWPEASPTQILLLWAEGLRGLRKRQGTVYQLIQLCNLYVCVQGAGASKLDFVVRGVHRARLSDSVSLNSLFCIGVTSTHTDNAVVAAARAARFSRSLCICICASFSFVSCLASGSLSLSAALRPAETRRDGAGYFYFCG